jgi:hypothetical protein
VLTGSRSLNTPRGGFSTLRTTREFATIRRVSSKHGGVVMSKAKASKSKRSAPAPRKVSTPRVGHRDAIRIVPLHQPGAAAAPAATPNLTYRNGPLISAVNVFTIFWGSGWKASAQATLISQLNQFFDFVVASPLVDQLAEYNVAKYPIKHGKRSGTVTITTPALRTSVTDTAIQAMLKQQIASNKAVPKPTVNTLYFVFIQPNVRVVMGGSSSCQAFCGYHNNIDAKTFYAVMPYPGCTGCTGSLSVLDALTSTSSHEFCEAITDPIPGEGWYDDANGEIGDICAWQTKTIGKYTVQLEWSNQAARCI